MEQLIVDLFAKWGPQGLGWIAAWLVWKAFLRLVTRLENLVETNTASNVSLAALIRDRKDGRGE